MDGEGLGSPWRGRGLAPRGGWRCGCGLIAPQGFAHCGLSLRDKTKPVWLRGGFSPAFIPSSVCSDKLLKATVAF